MRRCIAIIQTILLTVAVLATPNAVYAVDEVLITSNRDGNAEIYLVELGGKKQTNLTNDDADKPAVEVQSSGVESISYSRPRTLLSGWHSHSVALGDCNALSLAPIR